MNQYRCETCKNRKTVYGEYACEVVSRKMTKCFYEWVNKVGCASHSDFQLPTEGFIISREEFAELTRLYAARINSKNIGRIPAIFNSVRSHPYQSEREGFVLNTSEEIKRVRKDEREKVLDEVIKIIDGGISSIEDLKEDINKLRQKAGEHDGISHLQ
jgi:hypothetical protein